MNTVRPLLILGTRPEAIKMAPIVKECQSSGNHIDPIVCFTGQHREMLAQVADYFGIEADIDLDVMRPNQSLSELTTRCLEGIDATITRTNPDCIVAQGDTTTVLTASMAAFYRKIPFVHVEAGLRTGDIQSPWPEEFNRRVAGLVATLHCAPTTRAANNLLQEGVSPHLVHVTGNTVVDAILWTVMRERISDNPWKEKYDFLRDRRLVLITGHRRENFGANFESICRAISTLSNKFPDVEFLYPVHLNPNVREPVHRLLGNCSNVRLTDPAIYSEFVWLMDRSTLILTDSGGVQEEAPSLGKPVLVMRESTERPEAVESGAAELVGSSEVTIIAAVSRLLRTSHEHGHPPSTINPYGDGKAAARIVGLIQSRAWKNSAPWEARRAA